MKITDLLQFVILSCHFSVFFFPIFSCNFSISIYLMILGFFECVFPISLHFLPLFRLAGCIQLTFVFSLLLTHHFLFSSSVHLCRHGCKCSQNFAGLQFLSYVHMPCLGNTLSYTIFSYPISVDASKRSNCLRKSIARLESHYSPYIPMY